MINYGAHTLEMMASGDRVDFAIKATSVVFTGSGLVAGTLVELQDRYGSRLARYHVENPTENVELLANSMWLNGLHLAAAPGPDQGNWSVIVRFE